MIKLKGVITVAKGTPLTPELEDGIAKLKDGDYDFYFFDKKQNRVLPQLKYLNGVVLRAISEQSPTHPPIGALYRYYEQMFAPPHICNINGVRFTYKDLKAEPSDEVNDVIENIIRHAQINFGIQVPTIEDLKQAEAKELYAGAYAEDWKDYFSIHTNTSQQ